MTQKINLKSTRILGIELSFLCSLENETYKSCSPDFDFKSAKKGYYNSCNPNQN